MYVWEKNGREFGRDETIKVLRKTMEQVWGGGREEREWFVSGNETEEKKSTVM